MIFKKKKEAQPKYQIGQKVWMLDGQKAIEKEVQGIFKIYKYEKEIFDSFEYFLEKNHRASEYFWFKENRLFATKEELIQSL